MQVIDSGTKLKEGRWRVKNVARFGFAASFRWIGEHSEKRTK